MKLIIQNTSKIVELNGIPCRIWEGMTESGIVVHAYIPRVAIDKHELRAHEFEKELKEVCSPTPEIASIPLKLII